MQKFKTVLLALAAGVIAGSALVDFAGPGLLEWYSIPGGGQALCNCADIVNATATSIIKAHWIGGAVGGVVFGIAALAMGGAKGDKTAARGPTPPA